MRENRAWPIPVAVACGVAVLIALLLPVVAIAQTPAPAPAAGAAPAAAAGAAAAPAPAATPPLNIPPDAAREQAIQAQITARVPASEVVLLDVDGAKVLALLAPQSAKQPRGVVVIAHGMDGGADEPGLIHSLRKQLPQYGWSTLSVQMPVLPAGSPREAYGGIVEAAGKRIQAAVAHAQSLKQSNVVVIGQDVAAVAAISTLAESKDVKGIAALSLDFADGLNPPADPIAAMAKLKLPLLDLFGALGGENTRRLAVDRANAARNANLEGYSQAALIGRKQRLEGDSVPVASRLAAWMRRLKLDPVSPAAPAPVASP